jgi:hypothetical protein
LSAAEKFVCIHGHFYQPSRENLGLDAIEQQDSAHLYHDGNENITAECFAPNSASRISGFVRPFQSNESYNEMCKEITRLFEQSDFPEVIRLADRSFGTGSCTLRLLFREEQRKILRIMLQSALAEANSAYRQLYEHYATLLRFLTEAGELRPPQFQTAAEFTLIAYLRRALEQEPQDIKLIRARMAEVQKIGVNLWVAQNVFYEIMRKQYAEVKSRAGAGDDASKSWLELFHALGEKLAVQVP